jgi:hypothetical protein
LLALQRTPRLQHLRLHSNHVQRATIGTNNDVLDVLLGDMPTQLQQQRVLIVISEHTQVEVIELSVLRVELDILRIRQEPSTALHVRAALTRTRQ